MTQRQASRIFEDLQVRGRGISLKSYKEHLALLEEARERLLKLTGEGYNLEDGSLDIIPGEGPIEIEPPDYVVRKGDVVDFIFLLEGSERAAVGKDYWERITGNLFSKPVTGLILCWPRDLWTACAIDLYALRKYADSQGPAIKLEKESFFELADCVRDFYAQQFVDWKPGMIPSTKPSQPSAWSALPEQLAKALAESFRRMKASRFQIPEKVAAQEGLGEKDLEVITRSLVRMLSARQVESRDVEEFRNLFRKFQAPRND
ncbi:MAG: hypothetical protein ABSE79_16980 [Terriglobia bacterium]|jgi:hypothetical protein